MSFLSKTAAKTLVVLSAFSLFISSCNDEDKLQGQGGDTQKQEQFADSLNAAFAKQSRALAALAMEETIGVNSCSVQSNGTVQVVLTDGTSFVSYPGDVEYFGVLSYLVQEDQTVWAVLDKEGNAQVLKNNEGNAFSVASDPSLKRSKNGYVLSVNGVEFDTAFGAEDLVQAFKCVFHSDAASKVYAVTFDFGAELKKTYLVSSYDGVSFSLPYGEEASQITEYYVNYESTSAVVLNIPEGIEYTLKVSEGWNAAIRKEETKTYVDLTAPAKSAEAVPAVLEVVSEVSGVTMATLSLSNSPFRSVFASSTNAVVNPTVGVRKFIYGLSVVEDFTEDAAVQTAQAALTGNAIPQGCAVSEASVSVPFAELLGSELDPDKRYVLWAVPALYKEGADAGYYIDGTTVSKYEFGAMSFSLECVQTQLLDAQVKVSVKGADAVFGGVMQKSEDAMSDILYQLENSLLDSIPVTSQQFLYEGAMSDYPAVDAEKHEIFPETTYVLWVAAAYQGEYEYSEKDVYFIEVTTNGLVDGGALVASFGDVKVGPSTISVPVESKGASMIYYALLNNSDGGRYSSSEVPNAEKFQKMKENSLVSVKGSAATASFSKLNPSTSYWVYAVAVDADGKYGPVTCVSGKTEALVYDNSISLKVEMLERTAKKMVLKVTSTGGDLSDYIYWTGRITDPFWANSTHCGGTYRNAQKYMALNPDDENITRAMNKYGRLAEDGTIVIEGLTMETDYAFAILEKGEKNYSPIGYIKVTTLAADLGEIVKEGTPTWEAARNSAVIKWHKNQFEAAANSSMTASYGFNFDCPDNLTAYVMAASVNYFEGAGLTKIEHIMIEIENYASRRYANGYTPMLENGTLANEPDYYKNGELKAGQLMNVFAFNVHGLPQMGFVTYFAKGSHGEGNCIYWKNGICEQYEMDKASIARYNTLEPWQDRAKSFGLEGKEADDWANALKEAYSVYYKDAVPLIYENDGSGKGIDIYAPYAMGVNDEGVVNDRVVVMFKDHQGNYYEPMYFEVPNYFVAE